jgi:hypothetical protein
MIWGTQINLAPLGALMCGVIFGVVLTQFLLYPLRLSRSKWTYGGEILVGIVCLLGLLMPLAEIFGELAVRGLVLGFMTVFNPAGLLAIAIFLVLRAVWKRSATGNGSVNNLVGAGQDNQLPPKQKPTQLSLSEIIAVTISTGSMPLFFSAYGFGTIQTNSISTIPVALLLYSRAFKRLNFNNVPLGFERALFLFFYPYLVFGTIYCCSIFFLAALGMVGTAAKPAPPASLLLVLIALTVVGTWAAWRTKRAVQRQVKVNYDSFYDSTQPP